MAKLPTINCRRCGNELESEEFTPTSKGGAHYANSYESCLRKCERCGFGFSNATTDRTEDLTIIYRDPFWNVPRSIAEGCEFTLEHAMNVINRRSKRAKFASSKSEDHVTWTVFRYLQMNSGIRDILSKVGIDFVHRALVEPTLLLWAVPVPKDDPVGKNVRYQFEKVSDAIGEESNRRSEPDVILDFGSTGLVFIEMKLWSKNDIKKDDYGGWAKYLTSTEIYLDSEKVKHSGLYELARNWRIACEMANERPMTLVNLGPAELFENEAEVPIRLFHESLRLSPIRQFVKVTWKTFLDAIPIKPDWFNKYVQERKLVRV